MTTQDSSTPDTDAPIFPAAVFPAQARHARLLGVYPQRQAEKFMQRVLIPAGILTALQWRALAEIARRFTPDTPLHLTTRQDLELHDLSTANVPSTQQALAEAGLTSLGACGDTLRNITGCPCSAGGFCDVPDLLPLARQIGQVLGAYSGIFTLPRKFKVSLSGCEQACGRPFVNDLSYVAKRRDGRWGFGVVGAGSLGPRPATGIELFQWIAPEEALPLALAAVRLFDRLGDRQNRGRARLRHVRQRLGDEPFLAELRQEFETARKERAWPEVAISASSPVCRAKRVLTFPNGDVWPTAADALGALADTAGLSVRIANDHRVMLFAADALAADRELAKYPILSAAGQPQSNVVACPGTRWCPRALADTNELAGRIRARLAGQVETERLIAISGCPNGCAFSGVADVGITGGKSGSAGQTVEKYVLLTGGGQGRSNVLAQMKAAGLSAGQVQEQLG